MSAANNYYILTDKMPIFVERVCDLFNLIIFLNKIEKMNIIILGSWWHDLMFIEQVFWTIAIVFSILFILQLVSSIVGMDFDTDIDADFDFDTDLDGGGDGHFSIDPSFTLFSVRSIIAFFTFFGWVGVITLNNGMETKLAILVSFISGIIALFFVAFLLYQLIKLAEEGNVDIEDALGKYGKVYIPIPANRSNTGLISIELGDKLMELRAVTDGEKLPTDTLIYVFKILDDNVLLVGEIKDKEV